ncbi:unnamed protein product [Phyllotreta striolata]|uniref:Uncharacterized protein n=1 Tax=Phyllotreta striolata TaxID=444603 RepID=A0A9N9TTN3_PHYSR|nr:unnamed protein product [Phyllotreta striolata]
MAAREVFLAGIASFLIVCAGCVRDGKSNEKISVVLFFSETDQIPVTDLGVRFLGLKKVAEVEYNNIKESTNNYLVQRKIDQCQKNLQESLESLTHFCKNAIGVNVALVNINGSITEGDKPFTFNSKSKRNRKQKKNKISNAKTPPIDIVLSPQHTEVFKIRVKRKATEKDNKKNDIEHEKFIGEPVANTKDRHPWDVLDVWSHVRFSFFGKLLEDEKKANLAKQENQILPDESSRKRIDPGLFQTVQTALGSLQANSEAFLLIVFGGRLQEISEKYSPLVQTLKHIIENTDPENTIIVLTGNCLEYKNCNNGVVEINENVKESRKLRKIPVYAKGPNSNKLCECSLLYDIPLIIKDSLRESYPIFDSQ